MRGERFQAREKKVQKLGRDGLVEQNRATGEQQRVSERAADISFGSAHITEEAAPRRAGDSREGKKKRRKQPRPADAAGLLPSWTPAWDSAGLSPRPSDPPDTPEAPSMRTAADTPFDAAPEASASAPPIPPPGRRRRKKARKKRRRKQTAELADDAARCDSDEAPLSGKQSAAEGDRPSRLSADSGRLCFDTAAAERKNPPRDRDAIRKRQVRRFAQDAVRRTDKESEGPTPLEADRPSRLLPDGGRLHFDTTAAEEESQPCEQDAARKQQMRRFTQDGGRLHFSAEESPPEQSAGTDEPESRSAQKNRRLRFEDEDAASRQAQQRPIQQRQAEEAGAQAARTAGAAARNAGAAVRDTAARNAGAAARDAALPGGTRQDSGQEPLTPREQRQLEKAEKRVKKSTRRLEKAQAKLPAKRRLRVKKEYDAEAGKTRCRLRFEKEVIPEGAKPALPRRAGSALVWTAKTAAVTSVHHRLRQSEQDNTALEAAHKAEFLTERSAGCVLRWNRERLRTRPWRLLRKAEHRLAKDKAELAWRTTLRDRPELRRQLQTAKWWQKKQIRRKYAAACRYRQTAQQTQNAVHTAGQVVRFLVQQAMAHKSLLVLAALVGLVVLFLSAGLASCTVMLSSIQSSYIAASYMADEADICDSNLYYSELETDLQIDIDKTEETYPGYDEYRYNIQEISHDPYVLMGYLSAAFDAFRFSEVREKIETLFHEQYQLTREEIVETRYDSDGDPYSWYVLQTTLTVHPLGSLTAAKLTPGEQTDRYGVYMQTLGNRQAFDNPFDFPWLSYVSSPYGWRKNAAGAKELHTGIDLAAAQGTPIRAIHDGRVIAAGEMEDFGLCVTIADDKGYAARFAHCGSISVSAGQTVRRGDTIAAVGGAGTETGPHLHLEVLLNGEYLDPYYFVETGGGYSGGAGGGAVPGTPGGPVIPDYPGEAPSDETFAAILAEAEKYIGYPYVWGGASPSTSFDCSGYVSWVINHSGWNFGRLTAQGLYNVCTPVSAGSAKPGDLVFFTRTYSTAEPVTHVGIYIGNNQMLHCGNPIGYADLSSSYWQAHFYAFGRLP